MGLPLWKHAHLLRRFSEPTCSGGYAVSTYEDMYIMANIQTPSRKTSTAGDGDYPWQVIKVFTESQINTANDRTGTRGDWIWFQGKWFECRTSRHSNDTFLHHWTAEFVEIASQPPGPLYFYTCGTAFIINGTEETVWVDGSTLYLVDTDDLEVRDRVVVYDEAETVWTEDDIALYLAESDDFEVDVDDTTLTISGEDDAVWVDGTTLTLVDSNWPWYVGDGGQTLDVNGEEITTSEWAALEFLD